MYVWMHMLRLTNKLCVSFNYKHEYIGKMMEWAENMEPGMKLTTGSDS